MLNLNIVNNYYVYIHINKINNKKYIGITKQKPGTRWGHNGRNYYNSPVFYNAICKYGWENFDHKIYKEGLSKEEACNIEKELIASLKTQDREFGYNILEGGEAPSIPQETRDKMSKAMKGNKNCLGHKCPEDVKIKISAAQKGRKLTEQHKLLLSLAKKGKKKGPCPEYIKKKISESHKKKKIICEESGEIFESIHNCAKKLGLLATAICACCRGRIKSTGGLHFKYYDI